MPDSYVGPPIRAGSPDTNAVADIQNRLDALGIPARSGGGALVVDGLFGPTTESAVRLFQAQAADPGGRPLVIDGSVGPMTWASLFGTSVVRKSVSDDPLLERVLDLATGQIGVREMPPGSNRGPQVDLYLESCGLNPAAASYAWCAAFLYYCFDAAAKSLAVPNPLPRTAGVHDLWNQLGTDHRLRLTPGQASARPESIMPGMLFFLDAGGGLGHTGLIKAVNGVVLDTIEGNTTDIAGSREGIGVFERRSRTIANVNLGFANPSSSS